MFEISLLGLVHLALFIWAVFQITGSDDSTTAKVIWLIIVLLAPLIGWVVWFFFGPRAGRAA